MNDDAAAHGSKWGGIVIEGDIEILSFRDARVKIILMK